MKMLGFLRDMKMLKMLRCKSILLAGFLFFCAAAGGADQAKSNKWLVSPETVVDRMEILWQNKLPMDNSDSLERLFILNNYVYVLSANNYMVCLNSQTGSVIFSRYIAAQGIPVMGLALYSNKLVSIVGNNLVEIAPESGVEQNSEHLDFNAVCPAARNDAYFYVAGTDKCIRALRAKDKIPVFTFSAENDSAITSVIADGNSVIFATDKGNVISVRPDSHKQQWRFSAGGAVVGPIVEDADDLFFACRDTNIYKISALTGRFVWKCRMEAILDEAPVVTKEFVYQYVRDRGLAAIDKKSGRIIWQAAGGDKLLTEANEKAYVITNTGTLVVMDNKKAKQLYSVELAGISRYATNLTDSKIYVADGTGRITCLKPLK